MAGSTTSTASKASTKTSSPQNTAHAAAAPKTPHVYPSSRLANGTVAGIVVGAAIGLALITFLITFLIMQARLKRQSKRDRRLSGTGARSSQREKAPIENGVTATYESHLPQSADDGTVKTKAKTTLDQLELYVENFYLDRSAGTESSDKELATLETPHLSSTHSLGGLMKESKARIPIIKHVLAYIVTSSISPKGKVGTHLLPSEFTNLPQTLAISNARSRPGSDQALSKWRVLTAYLRPNASEDRIYITHRDNQTQQIVRAFTEAFAPWKNPKHLDKERADSLAVIVKEAADLGMWIFSQPSLLEFRWPKAVDRSIVVAPALVKASDERGDLLREPHVIVEPSTQKL